MRRSHLKVLAALAVLLLTLTGCSKEEPTITANDQVPASMVVEEDHGGEETETPDEPVDTVATLKFVAEDIKFTEAPTESPAGLVTIALVNDGAILHDVTIEELGAETVASADGGAADDGTIELPAGSYTYYCSVPGHRAAGMEGTLTVS